MVVMSHDANPSLKDTNYRFEQKYFIGRTQVNKNALTEKPFERNTLGKCWRQRTLLLRKRERVHDLQRGRTQLGKFSSKTI